MSQIWHTHAFRNSLPWLGEILHISVRRGLPFFESALYPDLLHINLEPEFNVTTRLSTPNAPILLRNFPEQDFYVVLWDPEWLKVFDDGHV